MKPVILVLVPVIALGVAVSACAPPNSVDLQSPTSAKEPSDPNAVWSRSDADVETELSIDPAVKAAQPGLYEVLFREGVADLRDFRREAAQARREDPTAAERMPWTMTIGYGEPVESERLYSLEGGSWSYAGGAHGNPLEHAVLWDKVGQRRIASRTLFRPGVDMRPLDAALCAAVNAAKIARAADQKNDPWDPASPAGTPDALWTCPLALETQMSLAPGDAPGRAGGLIFSIGPYVVGPYVEGGYVIVVPREAFAALLAPEWAGQFAGAPSAETIRLHRAG